MSKAKCIENDEQRHLLTVGKVYECLLDKDGDVVVICENGYNDWFPRRLFQLLPDEPKAEWMQMTDNGQFATFVHMPTGLCVGFTKSTKKASIWSLHSDADETRIDEARADAFAALVGYTRKEG